MSLFGYVNDYLIYTIFYEKDDIFAARQKADGLSSSDEIDLLPKRYEKQNNLTSIKEEIEKTSLSVYKKNRPKLKQQEKHNQGKNLQT